MKVLSEIDKINIAILDEHNYIVFDSRKSIETIDKEGVKRFRHKPSYHATLPEAVKEAARLLSNERAKGLHEWLGAYRDVCEELSL